MAVASKATIIKKKKARNISVELHFASNLNLLQKSISSHCRDRRKLETTIYRKEPKTNTLALMKL